MASFQELEPGKYKLYVELGYRGKRRIRRTKTINAKNKTEARKALVKFEADLLSKQIIDEDNITLEEFYPKWKSKYAVDQFSPSTFESNCNIIDGRILPEFKSVKLKDITKLDVVTFIKDLKPSNKKKTTLAPSTIHNIYKAFNSLMSVAKEWELIDRNPCENITLPSLEHEEAEVYTVEQAGNLFNRLEKYPKDWQLIVKIAAMTGARQGEIVALENKHLDFTNYTIRIEQAFVNVKEKGLVLKETKSKNKRTVSVPDDLMEELFEYVKEKKKQLFEVQNMREWEGHNFLFSSELGKPLRPDSVSQWWMRFMKNNNDLKRIRFHDLRHTSATLLLLDGVHPKVIQKRLGHSKYSFTMDTYSHVLDEMDRTAADTFSDMFSKNKRKSDTK